MVFKEAFTRGGDSEKNLLFDDEAFFYFAISIIMIIIIPLTYMVISVFIKNVIFDGEAKKLNRTP
jgi:translocation protein SEC63